MNCAVLNGDDPVDKVADGDDAEDLVAVEHRQMSDAVGGHQPHTLFHRVTRIHMDDIAGKDFLHRRLFRRFAFERHFARIIPLRQDADEFVPVRDEHRSDVLVSHELDGFKYGGLRGDAPDSSTFLSQDFVNGADRIHCSDSAVNGYHTVESYHERE